jgi:hypothetical protein
LKALHHKHGGLTTIDNQLELNCYAKDEEREVRKVIATTDKSLMCKCNICKGSYYAGKTTDGNKVICLNCIYGLKMLPQIPESFIKSYDLM